MFLSKSGFAQLAGVSAMSITKACSKGKMPLLPALVGKKIDPDHPAAVLYLEKVAKKKAGQSEDVVKKTVSQKPAKNDKQKKEIVKKPVKATIKPVEPVKTKNNSAKKDSNERTRQKTYPVNQSPGNVYSVENLLGEIGKYEEEHDQFKAAREFIKKKMIRDLPADVRELAHMSLNDLVSIFGTAPEFVKWLEATHKIEKTAEMRIKNAKTLGELISREVIVSAFLNNIDGAFRSLISDGAKSIERDLRIEFKKDSTAEKCVVKVERVMSKYIRMAKGKMSNGLKRIKN